MNSTKNIQTSDTRKLNVSDFKVRGVTWIQKQKNNGISFGYEYKNKLSGEGKKPKVGRVFEFIFNNDNTYLHSKEFLDEYSTKNKFIVTRIIKEKSLCGDGTWYKSMKITGRLENV